MERVLGGVAIAALTAAPALAGGIERSSQSVGIIFEEGRYAEFSFGAVSPSISGVQSGGSIASGDVIKDYQTFSFGYTQDLTDNIDFAVIIDQPIGADVKYPNTPGYVFAGATADVDSTAVTGVLRYKFQNNLSVYGGIRIQSSEGKVGIPIFSGYTMTADKETDAGYLLGIAWEKPEIAARVALTYNSEIEHTFDSVTEFGAPSAPFEVTVPQSVNLEFQTGIAADTLLFGSIRWAEWTEFAITPAVFSTAVLPGTSIVDYDNDVFTYNLGVGRKFNDTWSGAVFVGYEKSNGGFSANLGPTDGFKSIGLAATYTRDKMKITGAIRYVDIGDATTNLRAGGTGDFSGNDAIALGVRVGYSF